MCEHHACLWKISGSPSGPSKQSNSMQRHPILKMRRYISTEEREVSWLPVRYELCDESIQ